MADTRFNAASIATNLSESVWSVDPLAWAYYDMELGNLVGTNPNSVIQIKSDLVSKAGDDITLPLLVPLAGEGVVDEATLEGSEEAMKIYDFNVAVHQYRQAVKLQGSLTEQKTAMDLRKMAKSLLAGWWQQKLDTLTLYALSGIVSVDTTIAVNAPSSARRWYGGQTSGDVLEAVANDAAIDSSTNNLFGTAVIEAIKRKAMIANGQTNPKIRPIKYKGKDWYYMLIHPYQAKALKASTAWKNGKLYADVRGENNPLFTGSLGAWDGVILKEYDKILTRTGAGGATLGTEAFEAADGVANGVSAARALFLGAQACVHAYGHVGGQKGMRIDPKTFDYGDKWGCSGTVIGGIGKTEFNSQDFGVITVDTAYVAD